MNQVQKQMLLDQLRDGVRMVDARKAVKVTKAQVVAEIEADPEFEDLLALAEETGKRKKAPPLEAPLTPALANQMLDTLRPGLPSDVSDADIDHTGVFPPPVDAPPPQPAPIPITQQRVQLLGVPRPLVIVDTNEIPRFDADKIVLEAAKLGPGMFGFLLWADRLYVQHGLPPISAWWRFSLGSFYNSEKTWGIFMVGRGGGKSTTLTRASSNEVHFAPAVTPRRVPPGQRWLWPFISVGTADAGRRIQEMQALIRALGLEVAIKNEHGKMLINTTDIAGNDVSFNCFAATIGSVSGPSGLGGVVDEEAKLRDRSANVNPSTEIIASMSQMFRARPGIRAFRCSSAWRESGSHWQSISEGDNDKTFIARIGEAFIGLAKEGLYEVAAHETDTEGQREIRRYAGLLTAQSPNIPTWVANPTISAMASRKEIDAVPVDPFDKTIPRWRIWLRENVSVPQKMDAAGSNNQIEGLLEANQKLAESGGKPTRKIGVL